VVDSSGREKLHKGVKNIEKKEEEFTFCSQFSRLSNEQKRLEAQINYLKGTTVFIMSQSYFTIIDKIM